jgi:flagellar hook-associated protein 1 FlgK
MASLLTSLLNSANAIDVMDRQLAVVQNNVANANTPGYVRQTQSVQAMPMEPDSGLLGGVTAGPVLSARSEYAEETVRRQSSLYGSAEQRAADLAEVEPLFDLNSSSGISNTLNNFFQSFSQLSVNPNDTVSRQNVIDEAGNVAQAFQQTATGLVKAQENASVGFRSVISQINDLTSQIAHLNASRISDYRNALDPGADAQMHAALENLSELADVVVLQDKNGAFNVYLGGQAPLVIEDHQYALAAGASTSETQIVDFQGKDISGVIHSGKLGGLIDEQRNVIPQYQGQLDQLASTFATAVNNQLKAGLDAKGATPAVDLFSFDPAAPANTLAATDIQPDRIAAASAGAPGGNGNALDMAALADQKLVGSYTLTQAYGNLASRVGQDISSSSDERQSQESLVAQARNMRDQTSAVSLDEEASLMMTIQRQYQAVAKVIGTLNDLTDTLISMVK